MNNLSPRLQAALHSESPESDTTFALIITLVESVDWIEETRRLKEAGLRIESEWVEIRAVSGHANRQSIQGIADNHAVAFIDLEGSASAMDAV